MSKYKHLIWSNTDLNYEDWRADLESEYPELSEDERMERMYEINADYLDDERMNLNITLGMPILIIADLGDLRCDADHHDGSNHYLYRVYKDGVSETQMDNLKDKIYRGVATRTDITRITRRLGDDIGRVYGWTFPQRKSTKKQA